MRTYISPIGYDTRRVSRPVVRNGLAADDTIVLLRPAMNTDTEQSEQAIADVRQLFQEIEPAATVTVESVPTTSLVATTRACSELIQAAAGRLVLSLGGGARDVLLPLMLAGLLHADRVDETFFFSDLDGSVTTWHLPDLSTGPPGRTLPTITALRELDDWVSLTSLAETTGQSKSTIVRHIDDLETAGLVDVRQQGKAKEVRLYDRAALVLRAYRDES